VSQTELERERRLLSRLEAILRCAIAEGAYGTPALDRNIAETRAVIAELEACGRPVDAPDEAST
jgi:hypothetical protein